MVFIDLIPDNPTIWQYKDLTFKILGEISHLAFWVQNGDEIEIEESCKAPDGIITYKVKCSKCKTYH